MIRETVSESVRRSRRLRWFGDRRGGRHRCRSHRRVEIRTVTGFLAGYDQSEAAAGGFKVRDGLFGEMPMPLDFRAFAVADHQVAKIYIQDIGPNEVRAVLERMKGMDTVRP